MIKTEQPEQNKINPNKPSCLKKKEGGVGLKEAEAVIKNNVI